MLPATDAEVAYLKAAGVVLPNANVLNAQVLSRRAAPPPRRALTSPPAAVVDAAADGRSAHAFGCAAGYEKWLA